jgi:hypothetical protein
MKKYFFLVLFSIPTVMFAFDWPVEKKNISTNFCQNKSGDFNVGMVFSANDEPVFPIAEGDIIFSHEEGETVSRIPYGLGSFVAISHEGGIQSVYSHLKKGSLNKNATKIQKKEQIGLTGNTGSSTGNNMFLEIFNGEDYEILNPVKNLSPLQKDSVIPVIREIRLKSETTSVRIDNAKTIINGKYEVLVNTYDPGDDIMRSNSLAPYKLSVSLNGNEIMSITFAALKEKKYELVTTITEKNFKDIFESSDFYRLGFVDLVEGKHHIQVISSDFVGNHSIKDIFLEVHR